MTNLWPMLFSLTCSCPKQPFTSFRGRLLSLFSLYFQPQASSSPTSSPWLFHGGSAKSIAYMFTLLQMMLPSYSTNNTTKLKVCVLLFLLLACSTQQKFSAQGRLTARFMIGSRPPNCERKCLNCRRCDAIQVPTSPQETKPAMNPYWVIKARRDDSSNYKPMSWKCKCGNHFFNP